MRSSGIDVLSRDSCLLPSTNSSTSLPLMLWPPRCWPAGGSSVSTLTMRLSIVPSPGGPTGEGSSIKENCARPARLGKSTQASAAVSCCQGLQPPVALHLQPGQGNLHQVSIQLLQFPQLQKGPCMQAL